MNQRQDALGPISVGPKNESTRCSPSRPAMSGVNTSALASAAGRHAPASAKARHTYICRRLYRHHRHPCRGYRPLAGCLKQPGGGGQHRSRNGQGLRDAWSRAAPVWLRAGPQVEGGQQQAPVRVHEGVPLAPDHAPGRVVASLACHAHRARPRGLCVHHGRAGRRLAPTPLAVGRGEGVPCARTCHALERAMHSNVPVQAGRRNQRCTVPCGGKSRGRRSQAQPVRST